MPKRKNIVIKTKYKSKSECIEECRDIKNKTIMAMNLNRKISGSMTPDGRFELSSRAKVAAMYEFIGYVEENSDGVFMVGDIQAKKLQKTLILISIVLFSLLGMGFILTFDPVMLFIGVLFMIVPWINFIIMKQSDALYKEIIRKVAK